MSWVESCVEGTFKELLPRGHLRGSPAHSFRIAEGKTRHFSQGPVAEERSCRAGPGGHRETATVPGDGQTITDGDEAASVLGSSSSHS